MQLKSNYLKLETIDLLPRLPLDGSIDLTYRCNNNCRHCWLRIPVDSPEGKQELSFEEIKVIANEARAMGCRKWSISGGEPMLRPDFSQIFDLLTRNNNSYSLNTNGTLITPKIARLLKRKGLKMVALYGATAKIHDHITRNPGSFEQTMAGISYLKEAGASFIVQIVPMKDNFHQLQDMVELSGSLAKNYRIGASWLHLSAYGRKDKNKEILSQRLLPKQVIELDKPDLSYEESNSYCTKKEGAPNHVIQGLGLFSLCINSRRDFHIDPYGKMSFCCFVKNPSLRYDLRRGDFKTSWEEFIPSLTNKVKATKEYADKCASCEFRKDCRWCPVYAYLEHGRFHSKVNYLCSIAKEARKTKEGWKKAHRRFFKIGGITIQVDSDLPINKRTFHPNFRHFKAIGPGEDTIYIRHHFSLPDLNGQDLGKEVYRKAPWAIYKKNGSWIYLGISPIEGIKELHKVAVFNSDHSRARIYNDKEKMFLQGGSRSLTLFPTDQVLLARILADRNGCLLHSCGLDFEGKGLLFAGHSEAGKSTIATMFKGKAEILCDDRIIVRRWPEGFKIHGTWSHGDVPDISGNSVPLKAIFFINKSNENRLELLKDRKQINRRLLECLIKSLVTVDWWEKTLILIDKISGEVPCYELYFDKSGTLPGFLAKFLSL